MCKKTNLHGDFNLHYKNIIYTETKNLNLQKILKNLNLHGDFTEKCVHFANRKSYGSPCKLKIVDSPCKLKSVN